MSRVSLVVASKVEEDAIITVSAPALCALTIDQWVGITGSLDSSSGEAGGGPEIITVSAPASRVKTVDQWVGMAGLLDSLSGEAGGGPEVITVSAPASRVKTVDLWVGMAGPLGLSPEDAGRGLVQVATSCGSTQVSVLQGVHVKGSGAEVAGIKGWHGRCGASRLRIPAEKLTHS